MESAALCLGLMALLGLILTLVVYPPYFLLGAAARFHIFVFPNDAIDYRLAWQALVDHGRPWPLLWTDLFNYRHGFPISLFDAPPLPPTMFRPFISWLPADFHYLGLCHAVAVTLRHLRGGELSCSTRAGRFRFLAMEHDRRRTRFPARDVQRARSGHRAGRLAWMGLRSARGRWTRLFAPVSHFSR